MKLTSLLSLMLIATAVVSRADDVNDPSSINLLKTRSNFLEVCHGDFRVSLIDAAELETAERKLHCIVVQVAKQKVRQIPIQPGDTLGNILNALKIKWSGRPQLRLIKRKTIIQSELLYPKIDDFLRTEILPGDIIIFALQE